MLKLGIGYGGIKYASTKSSTTENTATSSLVNELAEGSIAIYGVLATTGALQLVTGVPSAGTYTEFMIVQGGKDTDELIQLAKFRPSELVKLSGSTYVQPTYQHAYIGYNGQSGALNNSTTVVGDTASVGVKNRMFTNNPILQDPMAYDAGKIPASATGYQILAPIANGLNTTKAALRLAKGFVTAAGSTADFTGSAVSLKFTKGSKTVAFVDYDLAASTGSVNAGDIIAIPSITGRSFSFTASALGSNSGNHKITIGTTTYTVADAGNPGTAAQNATAIAAAINAGTQATASANGSTVTITYNESTYTTPPLVYNDNSGAHIAVTVVTGDDTPALYKAANTVSTAASFELDYEWVGETCYAKGGTTEATDCGIYTVSGNYGLKVIGESFGKLLIVSADGVLSKADITYGTSLAGAFSEVDANFGIGTNPELVNLEGSGMYWRGAMDTASLPNKSPKTKYVRTGKIYDMYTLHIMTSYAAPFGTSSKVGNNVSTLVVAFEKTSPDTNGTSNYNQKSFDDFINGIAALNPTCITTNSNLV